MIALSIVFFRATSVLSNIIEQVLLKILEQIEMSFKDFRTSSRDVLCTILD